MERTVNWKPTLIICPYACGYVFDKGLQAVYFDPLTGDKGTYPMTDPGVTVCSRCKRALSFDGAVLHKLDEATLSDEERAQLAGARLMIRVVELTHGKRY